MNNKWRIEGDYLVRDRGGLGDFDPNAIYERIINLRENLNKNNDGRLTFHYCYRKVACEYGLKIGTVKYLYSCLNNKQIRHRGIQ